MITFNEFMTHYEKNAKNILKNNKNLFFVDVEKDKIWKTYLESFPSEYNPVYRTRREMDCSCCRSFIKNFGNVVAIVDNKIVSFWDFRTGDEGYDQVLESMETLVKSKCVRDVFITKDHTIGTIKNNEYVDGNVVTWNHLFVLLPKNLVCIGYNSINEIMGGYRDIRNVFHRSLEELSLDSVKEVLDLIAEKSLYRGEEWSSVLEKFLKYQKEYKKLKNNSEKENFVWVKSIEAGGVVGKIRNHSIGTLLIDITNGVDTEEAIRKYESIVAPTNYKRPKPIITSKMIDSAQKTIESLGLIDSLGRRHARIDDITINNVLWANRNAKKSMKDGSSIFSELKEEMAISPKKFENIKGISIESFLEKLPEIKKLEVLLENRSVGNLFSLIAPINKESPSMFKWDNAFSWSYNGNMADSMRERVKSAGGKVDGVLRFSIQWNTENDNKNDFDAHCVEPNGNEIFYQNKTYVHPSSGVLDVDIIHPTSKPAVENITWSDLKKMKAGKYSFFVHNFSHNGGTSGFDAEIEFNGEIYEFSYHKDIRYKENIYVADIYIDNDKNITIKPLLEHATSNKSVWNIKTNVFSPVSVFMFSPNYWDGQQGTGNRHYFFVLSNCMNSESPNGFYNEYLKEDLLKHKKVFEVLGSRMKVENSEQQLSGVGFSSTKRDYIIAKIDSNITKIIF